MYDVLILCSASSSMSASYTALCLPILDYLRLYCTATHYTHYVDLLLTQLFFHPFTFAYML